MRGFRPRSQVGTQQSLHNLLQYRPLTSPLNLKHLSIQHSLLKIDTTTIPHLRNLTSLTLLNVVELDTIQFNSTTGNEVHTNPSLIQSQQHVGSNLSDFWASFSQIGVHLKSIHIDKPVTAFFSYLGTYHGLTTLHISSGHFPSRDASRNTALQLYESAIFTKHSNTLEKLNINAWYDDYWCFCPPAAPAIQKMSRLRVLTICIGRSWGIQPTMNKLFQVLFRIPTIEEIHISSFGSYSNKDEMREAQNTRISKEIMLEVINCKLSADETETKAVPTIFVASPSGITVFRPRPLSAIFTREDRLIYLRDNKEYDYN
ncbi:hypothetical protein CVT24_009637 [Panaeolus cyanescens]|uniref:F-box domain-containing protein n=1 Tax=Panaeolus cyanescens TaxID=181874 RepID=A0A409YA19_9AGAR|nr:hypothetical protein CVT24_009637 [Panaeolus cyanescens]